MDDFHLRWKDYKRRRNQLLFVFVGYVPIMLAFGILSEKLLQTDKPVYVFGIFWLLLYGVALVRYQIFPCPRCGKWFFASWLYHNIFARRCIHCKLPLYSPKS